MSMDKVRTTIVLEKPVLEEFKKLDINLSEWVRHQMRQAIDQNGELGQEKELKKHIRKNFLNRDPSDLVVYTLAKDYGLTEKRVKELITLTRQEEKEK